MRKVAASFRTTDRAALESDLMLHWLDLKRHTRRDIRNWNAYLKTALRNKALSWLRDRQEAEADQKLVSLNMPLPKATIQDEEPATLEDRLKSAEPNLDFLIAVGDLLEKCDPWLCAVWKALLQTDGNQTRAARRLRVHRNTIRHSIQLIEELLKRHGFGDRR